MVSNVVDVEEIVKDIHGNIPTFIDDKDEMQVVCMSIALLLMKID